LERRRVGLSAGTVVIVLVLLLYLFGLCSVEGCVVGWSFLCTVASKLTYSVQRRIDSRLGGKLGWKCFVRKSTVLRFGLASSSLS